MRLLYLMSVTLPLAACLGGAQVVHREGEPPVIYFEDEDPQMNVAIENARSSFGAFVEQLPRLRKSGAYFSVKVPVPAGDDTEHVWLSDPEVRDGRVYGKLGNEPLSGPYELGDAVSVPTREISDWMAIVDGELYGGFTVLVARSRMSEAERNDLDRSLGFRVPQVPREF